MQFRSYKWERRHVPVKLEAVQKYDTYRREDNEIDNVNENEVLSAMEICV